MRLLGLALLAAATPAIAAEQYDLACQGTKITRQGAAGAPYAFEVRVDLAAQRWCMEACTAARPINAVAADTLTLADDSTYNTRTDASNSVTLNRRSNAFRQLAMQTWPEEKYLKIEAACTPQPFKPLPATADRSTAPGG